MAVKSSPGCHFAPPTVAEGFVSDHVAAFEGCGAGFLVVAWSVSHNKPGFCSLCQEQIATAFDIHMMNVHLELGQLWRCPVEWCTVWKGSVSDCLGQDMHGVFQYVAVKNLGKFCPPWTVFRDLCLTALRPDISGIAVDV